MISAPLLLFVLLATTVSAYQDSNVYPWGTDPNNRFPHYYKDAANVLQDLDEFQALYITVHNCVWSECGVDNFDDDGENHDGDEDWYSGRTVGMCANVAYSLYGIKRGSISLGINTCNKGTYINSFFTYGGADNLIAQVLGKSVDLYGVTLRENNNNNNNNKNDKDNDNDSGYSNADCYDWSDNNNNNNNNDKKQRELGSGDSKDNNNNNDADAVSATMGCDLSGNFVWASFQGAYCDGNYYLDTLDSLKDYNKIMNKVSCTRIWNRNKDSLRRRLEEEQEQQQNDDDANGDDYYISSSVAEELLRNSWACDLRMYPSACPDPYGLKKTYTDVLVNVAQYGQNPRVAMFNARLQTPIQRLSILFFIVGVGLWFLSYLLRNKKRFKQAGGGIKGVLYVIRDDVTELMLQLWTFVAWACGAVAAACARCLKRTAAKRRQQKMKDKKQKKKKKSRDRSLKKKRRNRKHDKSHGEPMIGDNNDGDDENEYYDYTGASSAGSPASGAMSEDADEYDEAYARSMESSSNIGNSPSYVYEEDSCPSHPSYNPKIANSKSSSSRTKLFIPPILARYSRDSHHHQQQQQQQQQQPDAVHRPPKSPKQSKQQGDISSSKSNSFENHHHEIIDVANLSGEGSFTSNPDATRKPKQQQSPSSNRGASAGILDPVPFDQEADEPATTIL